MSRHVRIGSVVLLLVMLASMAAAVQKPVVQQTGTTHQLVLEAQDVITASDAAGGHLSTRDLLIIILVILGLALLGVIAL